MTDYLLVTDVGTWICADVPGLHQYSSPPDWVCNHKPRTRLTLWKQSVGFPEAESLDRIVSHLNQRPRRLIWQANRKRSS
jgi:hypothetical protein